MGAGQARLCGESSGKLTHKLLGCSQHPWWHCVHGVHLLGLQRRCCTTIHAARSSVRLQPLPAHASADSKNSVVCPVCATESCTSVNHESRDVHICISNCQFSIPQQAMPEHCLYAPGSSDDGLQRGCPLPRGLSGCSLCPVVSPAAVRCPVVSSGCCPLPRGLSGCCPLPTWSLRLLSAAPWSLRLLSAAPWSLRLLSAVPVVSPAAVRCPVSPAPVRCPVVSPAAVRCPVVSPAAVRCPVVSPAAVRCPLVCGRAQHLRNRLSCVFFKPLSQSQSLRELR